MLQIIANHMFTISATAMRNWLVKHLPGKHDTAGTLCNLQGIDEKKKKPTQFKHNR